MKKNDRYEYTLPHPERRMPVYKFKSRQSRFKRPLIFAVIFAVIFACALTFLILGYTNVGPLAPLLWHGGEKRPSVTTPEVTTDAEETSRPEETTAAPEDTTVPEETTADPLTELYTFTETPFSATQTGDLVLIDKAHSFVFEGMTAAPINVYGNKSSSYVLSTTALTLRADALTALNQMLDAFRDEGDGTQIMLYGAYRSAQEQEEKYRNYVAKYGQTQADIYSAAPGYSDFHTGTSFELRCYDSATGRNYELTHHNVADWFYANMAKYGFILRYPTAKASITGNDFEPFHFRYVGKVHATAMWENNLCLEEYLRVLRESHAFGQEPLRVTVNEQVYEVYYVAGAEDTVWTLPLPKDRPYTLSGDNCGGVIVTVEPIH